jgi:ribokinase
MSRVVVVGSLNMDIVARTERLPTSGETVPGTSLRYYPGGKGANQAVAAAKCRVPTALVGAVGGDDFGKTLRNVLREHGVDISHIETIADAATGTALIVVDDRGENAIVVIPGANGHVGEKHIKHMMIERGDVLISQFEIPIETVASALRYGREHGAVTILNSAPARKVPLDLLSLADILVLNETELRVLSGTDEADILTDAILAKAVHTIRDAAQRQIMVITLGARGAVIYDGDKAFAIAGRKVEAIDTTGAGDCFVGCLGARLAAGDTLDDALRYANGAASLCVQRAGAIPSMPDYGEVVRLLLH